MVRSGKGVKNGKDVGERLTLMAILHSYEVTGPVEHERAWDQATKLRKTLENARKTLIGYCDALAILAGVSTTTKGGSEHGKTKGIR